MRRALPVLSLLLFSVSVFATDVTIELAPVVHPPGANVLVVNATVTNHLDVDLTDVRVFANLSPGLTILAGQSDPMWLCRDDGTLQSVRCVASVLPAGQSVPLTFYVDALAGRWRLVAEARWGVEGAAYVDSVIWVPHDVHVTHDGDAEEGSLRRAIVLANEECEGLKLPCRIVFDEPMTLRPRTPLPVVWGDDIVIDGGGRVTLDGSEVSGGSGLEIETPAWNDTVVRGLTIRGFPWDGVHINRPGDFRRGRVAVEDCTIEGNGSRGVTAELDSEVSVRHNRIRYNGRSGVFAFSYSILVEDNLIEENGASGVFVGARGWDVRVLHNRIARNAHFGVAAARQIGHIEIRENSMAGNRISGIDRGLDGFDGYVHDELYVSDAYIPPPRITGARFDATTNQTTIRGTYFNAVDPPGPPRWGMWSIDLFRNAAADGQGETFLGRTAASNGEFSLVVEGDLRGSFITATGFRRLNLDGPTTWWWTSELAEAIEVR